jgi:hypothetical protein
MISSFLRCMRRSEISAGFSIRESSSVSIYKRVVFSNQWNCVRVLNVLLARSRRDSSTRLLVNSETIFARVRSSRKSSAPSAHKEQQPVRCAHATAHSPSSMSLTVSNPGRYLVSNHEPKSHRTALAVYAGLEIKNRKSLEKISLRWFETVGLTKPPSRIASTPRS